MNAMRSWVERLELGSGTNRGLNSSGRNLFSAGRSDDKGKALEEELGPNVAYYRADAAKRIRDRSADEFCRGTVWQTGLRGQ